MPSAARLVLPCQGYDAAGWKALTVLGQTGVGTVGLKGDSSAALIKNSIWSPDPASKATRGFQKSMKVISLQVWLAKQDRIHSALSTALAGCWILLRCFGILEPDVCARLLDIESWASWEIWRRPVGGAQLRMLSWFIWHQAGLKKS
jgi:hypothetical protein